jgi:type IV secretory pathway component VirB8
MDKKHISQNNHNDITLKIENQQFFKEARQWYFYKFCKPISERYFWLFLLLTLTISGFILYREISDWYPLKNVRPIILLNKDAEYIQIVKKMNNPDKNADLAILRHLITNYIKMREEFLKGSLNLIKIDTRLKKISNNSSREITKDFQNIFSLNNQENPLIRLGKNGARYTEILDVKINIKKKSFLEKLASTNYLTLPSNAIVIFKTEEHTGNEKKIEFWRAVISFNYSGVIIDKEKNTLSLEEFTVTDYQKSNI